mmetsp:Transcript_8377/g.14678  ORF Transcript_8377/g.14678 Transcript_8377/m.14678 type:complete len:599 (+) Transcript_8377:82-1878(+)
MFGGLSMKGEPKEESAAPPAVPAPAASSGFSFLQSSIGASPAATPPAASSVTSSDNNAASEPQSQQPDSSAASSMIGSAFGFMSSASSASSVGQEETTSAAATTAAPPPSIFAGLTTSSANEPAAASAPEPTAAPPSSGFSFFSSIPSPTAPAQPTAAAAPIESSNNGDAASTTSTAGSSFSFMGSMAGSEHKDNAGSEAGSLPVVQEKEAAAPSSSAGGMSGFSFLSSAGAPVPPPVMEQPPEEIEAASSPPDMSGFSFLSSASTPAVPAPPPSEVASPTMEQPPSLISENTQPTAPAPGDLLSISNPGLPVGSGVSWSAPPVGATKKVMKKKRGKRVGVASAAVSTTGAAELPPPNSIPEPAHPSSFKPPSIPDSAMSPHQPATPQNISTMQATPSTPTPYAITQPESPPMRIKAERAMDKADEFIREKQRKSAIAMAAERAMQDKGPGLMPRTSSMESGASDGGGWKMNNAMPNSPASPTDETYQAAKAAAGEAKKLATNHASHSKGKASLFSNIFHRGKHGGGGSKLSKHGIPSHSSHGGVVSPAPVSGMGFKRGGSNGSAGIPSPLPPTQESPKKDGNFLVWKSTVIERGYGK